MNVKKFKWRNALSCLNDGSNRNEEHSAQLNYESDWLKAIPHANCVNHSISNSAIAQQVNCFLKCNWRKEWNAAVRLPASLHSVNLISFNNFIVSFNLNYTPFVSRYRYVSNENKRFIRLQHECRSFFFSFSFSVKQLR